MTALDGVSGIVCNAHWQQDNQSLELNVAPSISHLIDEESITVI